MRGAANYIVLQFVLILDLGSLPRVESASSAGTDIRNIRQLCEGPAYVGVV